MTAFVTRLAASGTVSHYRARDWRRTWNHVGPLLLVALGVGMLLGSWVVLLIREFGG